MYVCICNSVTDSQIKRCVVEKGIRSVRGLRSQISACDQCGKCAVVARQIIAECLEQTSNNNRLPSAA